MLVLLFIVWIPNLIGRVSGSGPALIIDNEGIEERRLGLAKVKWSDVATVSIRRVRIDPDNITPPYQYVQYLCVEMVDEDRFRATAPAHVRLSSTLGEKVGVSRPLLSIDFRLLDRRIEEAFAAVKAIAPDKVRYES